MASAPSDIVQEHGAAGNSALVKRRFPSKGQTALSQDYVADQKLSLVLVLFILTLLMPVLFYVGTLRMTPYRLILVATTVPTLLMWLTGKAGRPNLIDFSFLLSALWGSLALLVYVANAESEQAGSLQTAGIFFVETMGPYLLSRVFVRSYAQFIKLSRFVFFTTLLLLPLALYEMTTRTGVVLNALSDFFTVYPESETEMRYGLSRAQVVFEHPILWGVFASSFYGLAISALGHGKSGFRKVLLGLPVAAATITSLSGGGIISLVVQAVISLWDRLTRKINHRWSILASIIMAAYIAVDATSNRTPFQVFVTYLTFSTSSSYNRIMIWQYGSADALANPIFGIGLGDWDRPSYMSPSIDNFWLVTALRYGIPAFASLAFAILLLMKRMGNAKISDPAVASARAALLTMYMGMIVAGCTVHFWNAIYCWFMFLIGMGQWILNHQPTETVNHQAPQPQRTEPLEEASSIAKLRKARGAPQNAKRKWL